MSLVNKPDRQILCFPAEFFKQAIVLISMLFLSVTNVGFAQHSNYQAGLDAYFAGDYEAAKKHWLNGAREEDPKSMFNLGLLHEQRKVGGADLTKANKWYRLAGKHGYPAADYHLALLLRGDESQSKLAQTLIHRAAKNGYEPARQALGLKAAPVITATNVAVSDVSASKVNPTSESPTSVSVTSAESEPSAESDKYLGEAWIKAQNQSQWTIQMLAFEKLASVKAFIDEHDLNRYAAYFTERTDKGVLYKLVYGSYVSKEQADQARQDLSDELKEYGPWLRPIENVQALLN